MSAFRETFWAFVGTTGPIIALANVLTFGDATDAVVRLRDQDRKPVPPGGKNWVKAKLFRLLRLGHIYFVGACFALALALTLLAALSLWQHKNVIAGPWVIVLLIITFALLFTLGACSAAFKRRLDDLEKSHERRPGGRAADDGGASVDAKPSI